MQVLDSAITLNGFPCCYWLHPVVIRDIFFVIWR
nr:MAG TPA: hypothetical protein [Caudoviricetes sp.]